MQDNSEFKKIVNEIEKIYTDVIPLNSEIDKKDFIADQSLPLTQEEIEKYMTSLNGNTARLKESGIDDLLLQPVMQKIDEIMTLLNKSEVISDISAFIEKASLYIKGVDLLKIHKNIKPNADAERLLNKLRYNASMSVEFNRKCNRHFTKMREQYEEAYKKFGQQPEPVLSTVSIPQDNPLFNKSDSNSHLDVITGVNESETPRRKTVKAKRNVKNTVKGLDIKPSDLAESSDKLTQTVKLYDLSESVTKWGSLYHKAQHESFIYTEGEPSLIDRGTTVIQPEVTTVNDSSIQLNTDQRESVLGSSNEKLQSESHDSPRTGSPSENALIPLFKASLTPLERENEPNKAIAKNGVESEVSSSLSSSSSSYVQMLTNISPQHLKREDSLQAQEALKPYPMPIVSYYSAKMLTEEGSEETVFVPLITGMECYRKPPVKIMNCKVDTGPDNDISSLQCKYVNVALRNDDGSYDDEIWAPIPMGFPIMTKPRATSTFFQQPSTRENVVSSISLDSLQKELDQVKLQLGIGQSD